MKVQDSTKLTVGTASVTIQNEVIRSWSGIVIMVCF